MTLFCDRLKEERSRLRYGQSEFAELAGVNRRSQANYENGERAPNADYLLAASKIGVDVTYLLTGNRLQKVVDDKLTAALRLSREKEPQGGVLTNLALEAFENEGKVAEPPRQDYLSDREQALLDNYRASSAKAKKVLEETAEIMADKARDTEKGS
jgi:transcriptional regulator with XRE-family HTH domain